MDSYLAFMVKYLNCRFIRVPANAKPIFWRTTQELNSHQAFGNFVLLALESPTLCWAPTPSWLAPSPPLLSAAHTVPSSIAARYGAGCGPGWLRTLHSSVLLLTQVSRVAAAELVGFRRPIKAGTTGEKKGGVGMLWASPNYGYLLVWALSCFPLPWPAQGLIFEYSCFTVYRLSLCSHYSGPEMVLKGDHFCLPRVTDCFWHSWGLGTSVRFLDPSWLYRNMLVFVFPLLILLFSPSYTLILLLTAWLLLKCCSCCFDFFFLLSRR